MAAKLSSRERTAILERTLREYGDELRAIARQNSSDEEEAEDALQSALMQFYEHYRYDENAVGWLTVAIKREAWRAERARSRRLAREVSVDPGVIGSMAASGDEDPAKLAEVNETMRELLRALAALPAHQRRALLLVASDRSSDEICDLTGWSLRQLRRYVTRGRAALRTMLEGGSFEVAGRGVGADEDVAL